MKMYCTSCAELHEAGTPHTAPPAPAPGVLSEGQLDRLFEDAMGDEYGVPWTRSFENLYAAYRALIEENQRLKEDIKEWICGKCNIVYPGPPTPGLDCVQCPSCQGHCGPRETILRRQAEAERDQLKGQVEEMKRAKSEILNMPCGPSVERVAEVFLELETLYYRTVFNDGAKARLSEVLRRARIDGANAARETAARYNELIMAVSHKYADESRHATALRYIRSAEQRGCSPSCVATAAALADQNSPSTNSAPYSPPSTPSL